MSERLAELARIADQPLTLAFHVPLTGVSDDLEAERLNCLLDALESFYEGRSVQVVFTGEEVAWAMLAPKLVSIPRGEVKFMAAAELAADLAPDAATALCQPRNAALVAALVASRVDCDLLLTLPHWVFPIRPFSANMLRDRCLEMSNVFRFDAPLAPSEELPSGPGILSTKRSRAVADELVALVSASYFADSQERSRIGKVLRTAELGLWWPDQRSTSFVHIIQPRPLASIAWPWQLQPWETSIGCYFLMISDAVPDDVSRISKIIYGALHK